MLEILELYGHVEKLIVTYRYIIPLEVTVPAKSFIGDLHRECIQMLSEEQQLTPLSDQVTV